MPKLVSFALVAVPLAVAGVVVAGLATAGSSPSVITYSSAMTPAAEVPRPKAPAGARGTFSATVTTNGTVREIRWKLTFSGLSGKAIAAHIHSGKKGRAGAVIVPLCGPCTTGQTGKAKLSSDAADTLEHGLAYVNVHTTKNAGGEVRGQVRLVKRVGSSPPAATEPATTTTDTTGGGYGSKVGY